MSDPWDAHKDIYYENMIANERPVLNLLGRSLLHFFPYAVATYMVRDPIAWGPQPRTLAELRMYALSWAIRSKPEWQPLDQQADLPVEERLTPNMVNYVLTELAAYARLSDPVSGIECGPFDAIWYSDRLIPTDLADRLRTAVASLESVPDESKDWHPGSNGQVLDLVHPSLYCIVYGRTQFRDNSNFTPLMPPPDEDGQITAEHSRSSRYSWLPSDFSVATDGSVKLTSSYINNLNPTKQKPLYPVVEAVISSFVPLFERVLSQINGEKQDLYRDITPGSGRIKVGRTYGTWAGYNAKYCGISVPCIWVKADELSVSRKKAAKFLPEAFEEYTGELEKTIVPYSLRGRTIQCIVKLANIHLTADNPKYPGGSWHVEGMLNERIVASGIYYYDEENITESQLAFRVTTGAPVYHQQDDDKCMDILYGLKRQVTSAGRALAWPNIYQHRVSPFRLLDPTKPGHRKIIAIFLVDPSIDPIPSATDIPPQQSDWVFEALEDPTSTFTRLPSELAIKVQEGFSDGLMSRAEAEDYRLKLMKERTQFIGGRGRELKHSFNMCEH
ncbi:hypothetical protein B0H14DRAFT_2740011 [Mycena olivaceomarginata]|nr:hypothetical protein B0H14DRAFT_2740011 [Mycena olivaceomarginata]